MISPNHTPAQRPPRAPLKNWLAAFAAIIIIPTGFLLGSWVHHRIHDDTTATLETPSHDQQQANERKQVAAETEPPTSQQPDKDLTEKARELLALERDSRRSQLQRDINEINAKMEYLRNRSGLNRGEKSNGAS